MIIGGWYVILFFHNNAAHLTLFTQFIFPGAQVLFSLTCMYCNVESIIYRVFIKYCVFSWKFRDFSELCQFCCSAGVLLAWFVYTHWHRGKTEKDQSLEFYKIFKNTIFNEHPVPGTQYCVCAYIKLIYLLGFNLHIQICLKLKFP